MLDNLVSIYSVDKENFSIRMELSNIKEHIQMENHKEKDRNTLQMASFIKDSLYKGK